MPTSDCLPVLRRYCRIYADAAILQPSQKHLKRVIAEMGGKNALIVMKVQTLIRQ